MYRSLRLTFRKGSESLKSHLDFFRGNPAATSLVREVTLLGQTAAPPEDDDPSLWLWVDTDDLRSIARAIPLMHTLTLSQCVLFGEYRRPSMQGQGFNSLKKVHHQEVAFLGGHSMSGFTPINVLWPFDEIQNLWLSFAPFSIIQKDMEASLDEAAVRDRCPPSLTTITFDSSTRFLYMVIQSLSPLSRRTLRNFYVDLTPQTCERFDHDWSQLLGLQDLTELRRLEFLVPIYTFPLCADSLKIWEYVLKNLRSLPPNLPNLFLTFDCGQILFNNVYDRLMVFPISSLHGVLNMLSPVTIVHVQLKASASSSPPVWERVVAECPAWAELERQQSVRCHKIPGVGPDPAFNANKAVGV